MRKWLEPSSWRLLLALPIVLAAAEARAHGTMEIPTSRTYQCFQENPERPKSAACKAAVSVAGTQAFYDWNGVNRLEANGQHRQIIPDGKLCSAGKPGFQGLDLARGDWPAKTLTPDGSGNFEFRWLATAPHATRQFSLYVTKNGYDPMRPLRWSDLEDEPFCSYDRLTLSEGRYAIPCRLPQGKAGNHVIYAIWQRSDSTEAFYACSDVRFAGSVVTPWRQIGQLRATQDLPVGSKVTFRLFDAALRDVESVSVVLQKDRNAADRWPQDLGLAVNGASRVASVGVMGSDGRITPAISATENGVFVNSTAAFTFQVDVAQPAPAEPPPDTSGPPARYVYPEGRGQYKAGTRVRAADGATYQCRPFPNSGWCNGWDLYYAPATGLAWKDAWTKVL